LRRPAESSQKLGQHALTIGKQLCKSTVFSGTSLTLYGIFRSSNAFGGPRRNLGTYYLATLLFKIYFRVNASFQWLQCAG
jgi:hypothetical protein